MACERDYLPTVRQLIPRIRDDMEKYPEIRKYMGRELASYLVGEAGILLLQWKLAPSEEVARQLCGHIEATIGDPRGVAWGGAGAMLAALFMYECTDDARWKELFLRSLGPLWDQWNYADELAAIFGRRNYTALRNCASEPFMASPPTPVC